MYSCVCHHHCMKKDFRPLLSLRYLNSARMDLNWARTNLRKKEKKLPSHYDKNHRTASLYIRNFYFCTRKHIEVGLNLPFAAGPKMLCLITWRNKFLLVTQPNPD